jgi:hypothetical protein
MLLGGLMKWMSLLDFRLTNVGAYAILLDDLLTDLSPRLTDVTTDMTDTDDDDDHKGQKDFVSSSTYPLVSHHVNLIQSQRHINLLVVHLVDPATNVTSRSSCISALLLIGMRSTYARMEILNTLVFRSGKSNFMTMFTEFQRGKLHQRLSEKRVSTSVCFGKY